MASRMIQLCQTSPPVVWSRDLRQISGLELGQSGWLAAGEVVEALVGEDLHHLSGIGEDQRGQLQSLGFQDRGVDGQGVNPG